MVIVQVSNVTIMVKSGERRIPNPGQMAITTTPTAISEIFPPDLLTMEVMVLGHVILAAMAPTPVQVTHRIVMGVVHSEMVNTVATVEITTEVKARILIIIAVTSIGATETVINNFSHDAS